jgi:hypothetical protein
MGGGGFDSKRVQAPDIGQKKTGSLEIGQKR